MKNARVAFEEYADNTSNLKGYQQIKCHMIFDIKIGEHLRHKARMVTDGHTITTPSSITYSSVVSRDSVQIALTIAALNKLKIRSCDIQNEYIAAPCRKMI